MLTLAVAAASLASLSQPAQAAALIDQAVFTDGYLSVSGPDVTLNGDVHTNGNFDISGGSTITGLTSAVGYVRNDGVDAPGAGANPGFLNGGFATGAGTFTAFPTMATVLSTLAAQGIFPDHEVFGNLMFSGSETYDGLFLVHGTVDFSSDFLGRATFLADGNIVVSGGASITGAVLNVDFPFGLVLYSAGGDVTVSDGVVRGSIAAKGTADVSGTSPVTQTPEPSSLLLLGIGCLGGAMTRKRKKA